MNILTKANFRKNKGTSIGLLILMILTSMLIGLVCLIFLDAYPSAEEEGKRLNAGDGVIILSNYTSEIEDAELKDVLSEDVETYETSSMLANGATSMKFGEGSIINELFINNANEFERTMNRSEIITEDTSITGHYIYLPNQFATSGGYHMGDTYEFELLGKTYSFPIRGFFSTTYFSSNNTGNYVFVLDDESYQEVAEKMGDTAKASVISFSLKDDVKPNKFKVSIMNELLTANPDMKVTIELFKDEISGKTFMAMILAVAFLVMAMILVIVILLMVKNSVTNYIRENMKTIGALKSIGYTSGKIRRSMYTMFGILAIIASVIGTGVSYVVMPVMATIVTGQSGTPYQVSLNLTATLVPVLFVIVFTLLVTFLSSKKIKKIEAIEALRDGQKSHTFRKNRVRLDKSVFGLNTSLALKTTLRNMKQNLITFFVTGLLVFGCVIGYQLYENYNVHPSMKYFSTEVADGGISTDIEAKDEVYDFLNDYDGVKNLRKVYMLSLFYKDEDKLFTYGIDDMDRLGNKDCCYEGDIPKYDNEIAVSGKFAKDYGYQVGDEIELKHGEKTSNYLITGLIQSTSNVGREGLMSEAAMSKLVNTEKSTVYFYFELDDTDKTNDVIDACTDKFGDHIIATANMQEVMEGLMTTFKSITTVMLTTMCAIAGFVILLVLFLMVRTLIYNKRKDYGIYKALGFTSGKLILQTAESFMPTIILSVVVSSIVSYFAANPYMSMMMRSFGMMKCNFPIPILGVVIIGVGMILIAFIFSILMARRIRKIEAYHMLVEE
ncbi:MAG: ABC transporter permease [Eubacterium sp.]|nr:ABC transporter permease [Eubacterium sp.]